MDIDRFSDIEETISFYTRNDFGIINSLLVGNMNEIWNIAEAAYNDNKGILKEYKDGIRSINSEYDKKWIKALQSRIIERIDDETKDKIIKTAKNDILNIFNALEPAAESIKLYRTAWVTDNNMADHTYPYAHQYKSLHLEVDDIAEIKIISSSSLTPYCEDAGIDCDFYRYEIFVPKNGFLLKLDQFECHNEEGEVLLPPMKCRVKNVRSGENERCKGIIELEYIKRLELSV